MEPKPSDRGTIRRRAPHNGMGVMFESLIPGVEHTEEADFGAEMLRVASDLEECFGAGLQQQMVQDFLVLQSERRQFMG